MELLLEDLPSKLEKTRRPVLLLVETHLSAARVRLVPRSQSFEALPSRYDEIPYSPLVARNRIVSIGDCRADRLRTYVSNDSESYSDGSVQ